MCDRREVGDRVVRKLGQVRRNGVRAESGDEQRVSVRSRTGDLRGAYGTARARLVLHDERLTGALRQRLRDDAPRRSVMPPTANGTTMRTVLLGQACCACANPEATRATTGSQRMSGSHYASERQEFHGRGFPCVRELHSTSLRAFNTSSATRKASVAAGRPQYTAVCRRISRSSSTVTAVVERAFHVVAQLRGTVERGQHGDVQDAAQLAIDALARPHPPEADLFGILVEHAVEGVALLALALHVSRRPSARSGFAGRSLCSPLRFLLSKSCTLRCARASSSRLRPRP